jgi:putative membrane protein
MLAKILISFVALQHFAFLILESFLWTHPIGLKVFRQTLEVATVSKNLAANQGLYNGFLALGLLWSLFSPHEIIRFQTAIFFLSCVVVAGIVGGITVSFKITLIQTLPALIALAVILLSNAEGSATKF